MSVRHASSLASAVGALVLDPQRLRPRRGASRFPNGTKLYDRTDHKYFGKVVGYEERHDFHNGTAPAPAILIETRKLIKRR